MEETADIKKARSSQPTSEPPERASDFSKQLVYKGNSFMHSGKISCPAELGLAQFFLKKEKKILSWGFLKSLGQFMFLLPITS